MPAESVDNLQSQINQLVNMVNDLTTRRVNTMTILGDESESDASCSYICNMPKAMGSDFTLNLSGSDMTIEEHPFWHLHPLLTPIRSPPQVTTQSSSEAEAKESDLSGGLSVASMVPKGQPYRPLLHSP